MKFVKISVGSLLYLYTLKKHGHIFQRQVQRTLPKRGPLSRATKKTLNKNWNTYNGYLFVVKIDQFALFARMYLPYLEYLR